jgi:hypothetical protein
MNQSNRSCDPHETRNPPAKRVLLNGKAQMIYVRSTLAHTVTRDATAARTDDSPAAPGVAAARLPAGYDRTDLRMLEWIAGHRRSRARMSELAA